MEAKAGCSNTINDAANNEPSTSSKKTRGEMLKERIAAKREADPTGWVEMQRQKTEKRLNTIAEKQAKNPEAAMNKRRIAAEKRLKTLAEKQACNPEAVKEKLRIAAEKRRMTIAAKAQQNPKAMQESIEKRRTTIAEKRAANPEAAKEKLRIAAEKRRMTIAAKAQQNPKAMQESIEKRRTTIAEKRAANPDAATEKERLAAEKRQKTIAATAEADPHTPRKVTEKRLNTTDKRRQANPERWNRITESRTSKLKGTLDNKRKQDAVGWETMHTKRGKRLSATLAKKQDTLQEQLAGGSQTKDDDQPVGEIYENKTASPKMSPSLPRTPIQSAASYTPQRGRPKKSCQRSLFQTDKDETTEVPSKDPWPAQLKKFTNKMKLGPTHVCSCCGGLFYFKGINVVNRDQLQLWGLSNDNIGAVLYLNPQRGQHKLCHTCKNTAKKKKIPRLALANGLDFVEMPSVLKDLTQLEQRLVSPRVPFMQIRMAGFEQQWALKGNVVNVENNLNMCVSSLPRRFDDNSVVQLKFMRRDAYKRPYIYDKIRPARVMAALRYLIQTPLYEQDNVTMSEDWDSYSSDAELPFMVEPEEEEEGNGEEAVAGNADQSFPGVEPQVESQESDDDCSSEGNAEVPFIFEDDDDDNSDLGLQNEGEQAELTCENVPTENETVAELMESSEESGAVDETQTFLFEDDISNIGIRIAPAEGNTPIPLYRDPNAQYLSFPKIFCGHPLEFNPAAKLTDTDIFKSFLRRYDRRCAVPEFLFYCFKISYNEKVRDAYSICLRQKPSHFQGEAITAGKVKDPGYLKDMISKDDGYAVYKNVRCTPAYWKEQCKRVTSMIRQLGVPAFFITLSAAETRWPELLILLLSILNDRLVGEDEIKDLSFEERAKLIREDPVTCMRHFEHKYREFLHTILIPEAGLFTPNGVEDHFSRIEFQARGSPHSHGIYWVKNAPQYDAENPDSEAECAQFIDKYITVQRDEGEEMEELIGYQFHRHTHTCRKGRRAVRLCRFKYPKPAMKETRILSPLPNDLPRSVHERLTNLYSIIQDYLEPWGKRDHQDDSSYEDMLNKLGVTEEEYINAIRTTIKRPAVFLKREPKESFINAYNKKILLSWRANMDIQFVLDGYACAKYVATYISKSGGGVSKLLRAAEGDVNDGNLRIANKLQQFAKILINGCEISAQEAAGFCLRTPFVSYSRDAVFLNTSMSTQRIRMLKPKRDLDQLEDESEDIYLKGAADRYAKRPPVMEDVCFAEFVTSWTKSKSKKSKANSTVELDEPADDVAVMMDDEDEADTENPYIRRKKAKILRFCNFNRATQPSDYWREQMLLFLPWRNEQSDIEDKGDFQSYALENEEVILDNSRQYYSVRKSIDSLQLPDIDFQFDPFEDQEEADDYERDENVEDDDMDEDNAYAEAFLNRRKRPAKPSKFLPPKLVDGEAYIKIMRSLNSRQRKFVMEVLHLLKTRRLPFHIFLSGGAGVGKSHVITAIVQSYMRFVNKLAHIPPDSYPVIVCAPTGKAAFNVFGMTLHNVFRLPPTQYAGAIAPLDEGTANTYRLKYKHTELFIIDEISMVGAIQLQHIDSRLRQLFDRHVPFGGKSILAVGHFRQLPPVAMSFVFQSPRLKGAEKVRGGLVSRNPLWELFSFYELLDIMRQRDAHAFCKALNNMAEGEMDEDDIKLIRSRIVRKEDAPKDAVWLFKTNKECQRHNAEVHAGMTTEHAVSTAEDMVTGHKSDYERRLFIALAKDFKREESDGLMYTVELQVGGIYFVTTNIDVSDGLFNGATGILKAIEHGVKPKTNIKIPISAWIEFAHPSIGQELRNNPSYARRVERLQFPTSWTPINRMKRPLNKTYHGMKITRKQIPLQAANGMTITKSQGSSLPKVVITVRPGMGGPSLYVGCSRPTSLEGFFVVGDFLPPPKPGPNDPVTMEMEKLRANPLQFHLLFPDPTESNNRLYFHNIEGFLLHRPDVIADENINAHHYIVFVEPKIMESYDISLPGYVNSYRENSAVTQVAHCSTAAPQSTSYCNSEGVLLFSKEDCSAPEDVSFSFLKDDRTSHHCLLLIGRMAGAVVIAAYRHPSFSSKRFLKLMADTILPFKDEQLMVFGDLNYDLTDCANQKILDFFSERNLLPNLGIGEPTTEYGSQLDVCFSNLPNLVCSVHETYYSYHKGLYIVW